MRIRHVVVPVSVRSISSRLRFQEASLHLPRYCTLMCLNSLVMFVMASSTGSLSMLLAP